MIGLIIIVFSIMMLLAIINHFRGGRKDDGAFAFTLVALALMALGVIFFYATAYNDGLSTGQGAPLTKLTTGEEYLVLHTFSVDDTTYLVIRGSDSNKTILYKPDDQTNASHIEVLGRFSTARISHEEIIKSNLNY